jgi:rod shape determining protein RodA
MTQDRFTFETEDVSLQHKVNDLVDWGLLLAVVAILGAGLISIYSATFQTSASIVFRNQLIYAGIGVGAAIIAYFTPQRWLSDLAYAAYALGIIGLIAVIPFGHEVNGQRCWIRLGSFSFQPSELAKITTLFAIARYSSKKGFDIRTLRDLSVVVGMVVLPIGLIMVQPDTGSATVFLAMLLGIYMWVGGDLFLLYTIICLPFIAIAALYNALFDVIWWVIGITILAAGGAFLFRRNIILTVAAVVLMIGISLTVEPVFDSLAPYQQNRLITLFEPERNPRGEGYHVIQSVMAVGSGGVTGKGFLQGTQTQLRYIPEQWTDFIYCVPTEEFGFVGGVTVIALLASVILRGINIAGSVRTRFSSVVAIGFASMLFYHTMVNIGMAIGLFPVMGIPLPFLSAGGTSLIMNLATVGLLMNFYKTRRRRTSRIAS